MANIYLVEKTTPNPDTNSADVELVSAFSNEHSAAVEADSLNKARREQWAKDFPKYAGDPDNLRTTYAVRAIGLKD